MTWRVLIVATLWLAGCGAVEMAAPPVAGRPVEALGIAARLPEGWTARVLIGAEGRPVLHAASFPLPAADDDTGSHAQSIIGSPRMAYVNVRELGQGTSGAPLPVAFARSDFGPPPGADPGCCYIRVASRDVAVSGRLFRITALSGSRDPPRHDVVEAVNALLSTLRLEPYEAPRAAPLEEGERLEGYGIRMLLPHRWQGNVSHGLVQLAGAGLELKLYENGGSDAPFVTARLPLQLVPSEFIPPEPGSSGRVAAVTSRSFVTAGRRFALWATAGSLPPSPAALAAANAALATLTVEPGDFYPGTVLPATFADAPGWYTGTSGPAEVDPNSEGTFTWASTIPYRDPPNALPMQRTLEALPPDGIVLFALLMRTHQHGSRQPALRLPYDLATAERGPFESVPADRAARRISARAPGGYDLHLWAFFGSPEPTARQVERAHAQLERLRLPDWRRSGLNPHVRRSAATSAPEWVAHGTDSRPAGITSIDAGGG